MANYKINYPGAEPRSILLIPRYSRILRDPGKPLWAGIHPAGTACGKFCQINKCSNREARIFETMLKIQMLKCSRRILLVLNIAILII